MEPRVKIEEDVYRYEPAENGANPQWCLGNPALVRVGDRLFASGLETIPNIKPLNNTRWILLTREDTGGWEVVYKDDARTREPSPIGAFPDGRLFLTANPTLTPVDTYAGPRPEVHEFNTARLAEPPKVHVPGWDEPANFSEHSYRSFAVDAASREFICFNNEVYDFAHWSFFDRDRKWSAQGKIVWPRTTEYGPTPTAPDRPLPVCYPNVVLTNRAVHVFGVSDVSEPNAEYRAFKYALTKHEGDYIYCRVFHTWTPDITRQPFGPWREIGNREKTRGSIWACDAWAAPDGDMHLLWWEKSVDERMRDKFFPGEVLTTTLMYARLNDGREVRRQTLLHAAEGTSSDSPEWGRFHVMPSGKLLVVALVKRGGAWA